jgi:hypothetical protein
LSLRKRESWNWRDSRIWGFSTQTDFWVFGTKSVHKLICNGYLRKLEFSSVIISRKKERKVNKVNVFPKKTQTKSKNIFFWHSFKINCSFFGQR